MDGICRALRLDMLRITESFDSENMVRLRLDGTIAEASFAQVEEAVMHHLRNRTIVLDMAGVVFMNNDAAKKIVQLRSEQLRIINCSPFIEILLNASADAPID